MQHKPKEDMTCIGYLENEFSKESKNKTMQDPN